MGQSSRDIRILGIETSCDETAAAVVEEGRQVLSNVVASQLDAHARFGGVVPELASREHLLAIVPVVRSAMGDAGCVWNDLDAVAVTTGPGLAGSLLVGTTYAKALSLARGLPLIAVNHVEGHIHAAVLDAARAGAPVRYPALALVVSGGHTHLFRVSENFDYRLLGKTRDDAAGEAYDKVAKLLGFGYPGGPVLDRLAPYGDPAEVRFSLARMKGNTLDFSFSGLKTGVLRWVESNSMVDEIAARTAFVREHQRPSLEEWLRLTPRRTLDLIAGFQANVVEELMRRAESAAAQIGAQSIVISGGVACNSGLRAAAVKTLTSRMVHFPPPALSTDNAVMIAAAAFPRFRRGEFASLSVEIDPSLALG